MQLAAGRLGVSKQALAAMSTEPHELHKRGGKGTDERLSVRRPGLAGKGRPLQRRTRGTTEEPGRHRRPRKFIAKPSQKSGDFTNSSGKDGASEGIRTLDIHLGKVTLYQTELRSLPTKRAYLTGIPQQCKPSFCSFCSSRRFFGDLSLPVATDPNVPVSTLGPLAGDPDGVWPRKRGPTALKPNPISLPGPVTGDP